MGRALLLLVALAVAGCRTGGSAPASPSCEIVVTHTADGRSGTVGCAPSATPSVAGTQQPPKHDKDKGTDGEGDHD